MILRKVLCTHIRYIVIFIQKLLDFFGSFLRDFAGFSVNDVRYRCGTDSQHFCHFFDCNHLKHPDVKKSVDIRVKMQKYLKSYILLCGYFSTMIYKNASIAQKNLK